MDGLPFGYAIQNGNRKRLFPLSDYSLDSLKVYKKLLSFFDFKGNLSIG